MTAPLERGCEAYSITRVCLSFPPRERTIEVICDKEILAVNGRCCALSTATAASWFGCCAEPDTKSGGCMALEHGVIFCCFRSTIQVRILCFEIQADVTRVCLAKD